MQSLKKYIHILWSGVPPLRSLSKEIILHFHKENSTLYNKASTWDSLNVYQLGTGSKWCSVQYGSVSHVWLFVTPWTAAHQASLSITNSQSLLRLMSIELVMPSNHLILCPPLFLPSIFPSIRVFSNKSELCRWKSNCDFEFLNFAVWYWNVFLNKKMWLCYTPFLCTFLILCFFANDIACYVFIFILDYRNFIRQEALLSDFLIWVPNGS